MRGHRLVVLPDYQGCGVGTALLDFVGSDCLDRGERFVFTATSPALFRAGNRPNWICKGLQDPSGNVRKFRKAGYSMPRIMLDLRYRHKVSFEMIDYPAGHPKSKLAASGATTSKPTTHTSVAESEIP